MTLNELLEDRSITLSEDADGFVTIGGRFVVGDSGLTDRALQDLAEGCLVSLRDDFKQYLQEEAFLGGMSVNHTRVCNGLYDVNAYHQTIEGGLKYSVSVAYGSHEGRTVPTFEIDTRRNELPKKVADTVRESFPIQAKRYSDLLKTHNEHLTNYSKRLKARH